MSMTVKLQLVPVMTIELTEDDSVTLQEILEDVASPPNGSSVWQDFASRYIDGISKARQSAITDLERDKALAGLRHKLASS